MSLFYRNSAKQPSPVGFLVPRNIVIPNEARNLALELQIFTGPPEIPSEIPRFARNDGKDRFGSFIPEQIHLGRTGTFGLVAHI